jgi:hypothetical protein
MADDDVPKPSGGGGGGFTKPPLKRGLKKPPGADADAESSAGTSGMGSLSSFLPQDAKSAFNSPPSQILSFIYLGSQYNAASKKQLVQLSIKRILDLKERHVASDMTEMTVHAVPMSDHGDTAITEILPECFEFIEQARTNNESVLVHWYASFSFSFSLLLLLLTYHWTSANPHGLPSGGSSIYGVCLPFGFISQSTLPFCSISRCGHHD